MRRRALTLPTLSTLPIPALGPPLDALLDEDELEEEEDEESEIDRVRARDSLLDADFAGSIGSDCPGG
ncbi:MAG TPA: hypothetical protein VGJ91_05490 [Polyangiaceae bacterium]